MKKYLFGLAVCALALTLTGCGKVDKVTCSQTTKVTYVTSTVKVDAKIVDDKLKTMSIKSKLYIDKDYASLVNMLKSSLQKNLNNYKGKGVTVSVSTKDNEVYGEVDFDVNKMNSSARKNVNGYNANSKLTKEDLIKNLKKQGYTCK